MNRAMLLTGTGSAAIAVVRIDGAGVQKFLQHCFDRPPQVGACVYGRIKDGQRILDDAVVMLEANHADLNLHGGIWIIHEVFQLLSQHGFQIINWTPDQTWACEGETELEREIASHLPLAATELAVSVLLNQRQAWERIKFSQRETLERMLSDRALEFLLHPPSVTIVGLPNVGKSTLANQLFAQKRSITADIPGTTRDWIGELANIDGLIVKLIDTPGQRQSDDAIETRAISAADSVITAAELIILVMDSTQDADAQKKMSRQWPSALIVINKSDLADWPGDGIRTVASCGVGIDEVRNEIRRHFGVLELGQEQARCWTERQRAEIEKMLRGKLSRSG